MKKVLISVAPVSAADILNNPIAIAKDVIACSKAGRAWCTCMSGI